MTCVPRNARLVAWTEITAEDDEIPWLLDRHFQARLRPQSGGSASSRTL